MNTKTLSNPHCETCGSSDYEDLNGDDGYTACCNEPTCNSGYSNPCSLVYFPNTQIEIQSGFGLGHWRHVKTTR